MVGQPAGSSKEGVYELRKADSFDKGHGALLRASRVIIALFLLVLFILAPFVGVNVGPAFLIPSTDSE
jgi:hypothetical protein